jgi:hypothetical protein
MRDLQRIRLVLTAALALAWPAFATGIDRGDRVAAIRSADYPCQQVLDLQETGNNAWRVQCNSDTYQVSRDEEGRFSVVRSN